MNPERFIGVRVAFMAVIRSMIPTEIVYFAVNRWDSLVQREQHLLMGLSRTYRVLFVDPPLSFSTIFFGKFQKKNWNFKSRLYRVNDQLTIFTPPAFPPFSQYTEGMNSIHTRLLILLTKKILKKIDFREFLVGVARPFLAGIIRGLTPQLSYYDCSDEYLKFPGLKADRTLLKKSEEDLLRCVDIVFCSSRRLKEAKSVFNPNCFLLPNGVDLAPFDGAAVDDPLPSKISGIKKPILGYIGTIGEWLDFDALIGVAKKRPDWSIVMIGPVASGRFSSVLSTVRNLHWLGEMDYQELTPYLKRFDVCLIPFKVNEFTQKIYPTKFHQYLACGKPVVSSRLPDLEPFIPWVAFYSDADEMEKEIERSLREHSEEKVLGRKRIASENTWDRRVESMIQIFNTFLNNRAAPH
jgi:glycosyltransferase involved in cell wall biosynthesis